MTENFEFAGWQRRLRNPTLPSSDYRAGWSKWENVSEELAEYTARDGAVDGFPELQAEVRRIYTEPDNYNTLYNKVPEISEEVLRMCEGIVGTCEATRNEYHNLWALHHYYAEKIGYTKLSWEASRDGYLSNVGYVNGCPVWVSLQVNVVDGHKILFYHATSQVVDHKMIRTWLDKNMPKSAFRDGGSLNNTDATNFTNVLPRK